MTLLQRCSSVIRFIRNKTSRAVTCQWKHSSAAGLCLSLFVSSLFVTGTTEAQRCKTHRGHIRKQINPVKLMNTTGDKHCQAKLGKLHEKQNEWLIMLEMIIILFKVIIWHIIVPFFPWNILLTHNKICSGGQAVRRHFHSFIYDLLTFNS